MRTTDIEREERLIEAAVEILKAVPDRRMNVTILNKCLFYLDLCSLRDRGETVTRSPYVALDQGPVLAKYKSRLIERLAERGLAYQKEQKHSPERPVVLRKVPGGPGHLDAYARRKAAEIARSFARRSSTEASRISHGNPGWRIAVRTGRGAGKPPRSIDLQIAMQEILGRDPWMERRQDPAFEAAVREAENGPRRPW